MSFFGTLGKKKESMVILSPVSGDAIPAEEIADEIFAQSMLGYTVGVQPKEGKLYAPADAKVSTLYETNHAVLLSLADGVEILIHVGIDTVKLQGRYFTPYTKNGNTVHAGELLLEFNMPAIEASGYQTTVSVIITNAETLGPIASQTGPKKHGDPLITIASK